MTHNENSSEQVESLPCIKQNSVNIFLFSQQPYGIGSLGTPFFKTKEGVHLMCPRELGLN